MEEGRPRHTLGGGPGTYCLDPQIQCPGLAKVCIPQDVSPIMYPLLAGSCARLSGCLPGGLQLTAQGPLER